MSRLSTCLIFLSLAMDPRLYCYRHHPLNWNLLSRHNAIHYLSAFRSKEHSVWLCNTLSSWGLVDDSLQICDNLQASLTNPLASIPSHSSWRYHQGLSLSPGSGQTVGEPSEGYKPPHSRVTQIEHLVLWDRLPHWRPQKLMRQHASRIASVGV